MLDESSSTGLFPAISALWTPLERLPLSVWAEKNITLSSEYSASSTEMRLFGWQKALFDAFTDPTVEEIVLCCATQLTKTILLQCIISYIVCCDPGPILLVQPNDDDAKTFSKERLQPMIRDNDCLKARMTENTVGGRDTITGKSFPGGSLSLVGAISPSNLARRSIRYLLCDEIDKYPASAGKEGDPVSLAWERTATFGSRRKGIYCCSPTVAGLSRIGKAYRATDRRRPWVTCPYCGFEQILVWEQVKDVTGGSFAYNHGATARYECANTSCKAKWTDLERSIAADKAVWKAEAPFTGRAGFWINHLYAPHTMIKAKSLSVMASTYLNAAHDSNLLKTFKNTNLALEWEEEGDVPDFQTLYDRREPYPFGTPQTAIIPMRGLFLTAAVDVQESPPRLEYEVVAWGRGRECWSMAYGTVEVLAENSEPLPVTSKELWDKLDAEILQAEWRHASGSYLTITAMAIDTGRRPKPVYEFARRHPQLRYTLAGYNWWAPKTIVPVKGLPDMLKILSSVSKEDAARKQQGVRIIGVGTYCAKQEIYDSLRHIRPSADASKPVPGCYHHPMYDLGYFQGKCSEVRVITDAGKVTWEQRRERNEPLDLAVYNRAAAAILGIDRWGEAQWRMLEETVRGPMPELEPVVERPKGPLSVTPPSPSAPRPPALSVQRPIPPPSPTQRRPIRGGFGV